MRFALLGEHPDGLDMARALAESGRHEILAYTGPDVGLDYLKRWGITPRTAGDMEDILADPDIDAVIVAGSPAARVAQTRRALQSEHHVLCVHPAAGNADQAYEADMLRGDVHRVLLPILAEALHPALRRLAQIAQLSPALASSTAITSHVDAITASQSAAADPEASRNTIVLLEIERGFSEGVLQQAEEKGRHASLPGWDTLRLLGGDVAEVFALSGAEELRPDAPLMLSGKFVRGGLFHVTMLPEQADNRLRLTLLSAVGQAELLFPQGWPGPAQLTYRDSTGEDHQESWPALDPWPSVVACFEAEVGLSTSPESQGRLSWKDALRALELDDAVRRSVRRHNSSVLDYQEATEEASFKGTMTLVGCGLVWVSLLLLIFSMWFPWLALLILPLFGTFLLMQFLRGFVERGDGSGQKK